MPALVELLTGELGLAVSVLLLLVYTVYENRRGTVKQTQDRLYAVAVAVFRIAQETDDVDEDAIRAEMFDNGSEIFPEDFDDDDPDQPNAHGGDD